MEGPSKWARRYRCLQVLQKGTNETVKFPLAALKTLYLLGVIRCIYGVIKMDGFIRVINFNCAVGFLVFLTVAFKALGEIYEKSEEALAQQKKMLKNRWFRRFHRSCWPLKMQVAGMYFIDSPMSLTMYSFIIINVANMLILGAWREETALWSNFLSIIIYVKNWATLTTTIPGNS